MVLDASLLNTQHYKVRIKGKVEQSRKGVAPSPTPWCSSYQKGSLRVTLDYGRQLYLLINPLLLAGYNTRSIVMCITSHFVLIQSFLSPKPVVIPSLKSLVDPTVHSLLGKNISIFTSLRYECCVKCKQSRPEFELDSPIQFWTLITATLQFPLWLNFYCSSYIQGRKLRESIMTVIDGVS